MPRQFAVAIERDEDGFYVASVRKLTGRRTQAESLDAAMRRIREAAELCLDVAGAPERGPRFLGIRRIAIAE